MQQQCLKTASIVLHFDQEQGTWKLKTALWVEEWCHCEPSTRPCLLEDEAWTAGEDGKVIRWANCGEDDSCLEPRALLCGHNSPVTVVTPLCGLGVFSLDCDGLACLWDTSTGECIARRNLRIRSQSAALQLSGGLLAVETQLCSKDGSLSSAGMLTLLDASLHTVTEVVPSRVLPLLSTAGQGKKPGTGKILALCETSGSDGVGLVGLTQQGLLLVWQLHSVDPLPQKAPRPAAELSISGELQDAAFSWEGRHLLAVSDSQWLLFSSSNWAAGYAAVRAGTQRTVAESSDQTQFEGSRCQGELRNPTNIAAAPTQTASGTREPTSGTRGRFFSTTSRSSVNYSDDGVDGSTQTSGSGRDLVGGILLEGWSCHGVAGLGSGVGALVWDRLGSGQLLWVSEGRAALTVASIQLSKGGCTTASVSFDGRNRIVVGRWDSGQLRLAWISLPSETSWGGWQVGGASEVPVTEWREEDHGARRDVVTVSLTSDAGSRAPHLLFKGYASGRVCAESLAEAALQLGKGGGSPGWQAERQLGSAVTCLLEHSTPVFNNRLGTVVVSLLLSGAKNGSVQAVDLKSGEPFLLLKLHTAEVLSLSAPPQGAPYPWSTCVLSQGGDGMFCLTSLEQRQCIRLLSGLPSPLASRPLFLWSAARGFIACSEGVHVAGVAAESLECGLHSPRRSPSSAATAAMAVLWDFQTGALDRVVGGQAAVDLIQDLATFQPVNSQLSPREPPFCLKSSRLGPHQQLHVLELDVGILLATPLGRQRYLSLGGLGDQMHPCDDILSLTEQVLLAIAFLHRTGTDSRADDLLLRALQKVSLAGKATVGSYIADGTGDVIEGMGGALTVGFPGSIRRTPRGSDWQSAPERLTLQLLAVVALAKALQEQSTELQDDSLAILLCNLGATLAALYTLRPRDLLPELPLPSPTVLAARFQDENVCVREAARTLLAAVSDPATSGLTGPPLYKLFASLILTGSWSDAALPEARSVWRPLHIITAAIICSLHPTAVPDELMAHALPGLLAVVCAVGSHSVPAAKLLSESVRNPRLVRWRSFLGDTKLLIDRLLAACEAASSEPVRTSGGATSPRSGHNLAGPEADRRSASLADALLEAHSGDGEKLAALRVSNGAAASVGRNTRPEALGGMPSRNALLDALAAVAETDLTTFLHILGHRLAAGGQGNSHLIALMTLARILHFDEGGRALIACHLPLLTTVVLKGLDPHNMTLRRTCRQGVAALIKELAIACPMVALHETSLQLAVGSPLPQGEPISVHDLSSGRKKRAVHFRPESHTDGGLATETVSALAFSPSGEALAAWTAGESSLRVWHLVAKWTTRLQRTPAILLPSKVFILEVRRHKQRRPAVSTGVDFKWDVLWESDSCISVLHDQTCVGKASL